MACSREGHRESRVRSKAAPPRLLVFWEVAEGIHTAHIGEICSEMNKLSKVRSKIMFCRKGQADVRGGGKGETPRTM